ncbi:DNA-directed RNA polymerase subunit alpha C-terminal domain-containing protein [Sphaerisporangium sp. NPDC004334]
MSDDTPQMKTITLPAHVWNDVLDALADRGEELMEKKWLGDCRDCDKLNDDEARCPQHTEEARSGAALHMHRDQIVDQLDKPLPTSWDHLPPIAEVIGISGLPGDTHIGTLALPTRIYHILAREPIWTIGELAHRTDDDLMELRGFGVGALRDLKLLLLRKAPDSAEHPVKMPLRRWQVTIDGLNAAAEAAGGDVAGEYDDVRDAIRDQLGLPAGE